MDQEEKMSVVIMRARRAMESVGMVVCDEETTEVGTIMSVSVIVDGSPMGVTITIQG